jgi:hypothetical protein
VSSPDAYRRTASDTYGLSDGVIGVDTFGRVMVKAGYLCAALGIVLASPVTAMRLICLPQASERIRSAGAVTIPFRAYLMCLAALHPE